MSAPAARVVVAIDFGTTFSGFAYARTSEPDKIFKFYEWPCYSKVGAKPYCKTQTSLFYVPSRTQLGRFELQDWGWSGLLQYSKVVAAHATTSHSPDLRAIDITSINQTASHSHIALNQATRKNDLHLLHVSTQHVEKVGFFATKFKLYLAPGQHEDMHEFPGDITAERMVVDYLRCLSDFVISELQMTYGKHFGKPDVQWCLTVPAIWDERAKQAMKTCAEKAGMVIGAACPLSEGASPHPIDIILEPEAASVYCQQRAKHVKLKKGDKLLVVDVGGGTIDVVVHEKADNDPESMHVQEVVKSYGELGGGTFVDANFLCFLCNKIKCFKDFSQNNVSLCLKIYEWWQSIKTGFDGEGYSAEMMLPRKLSDAWEKYDKDMGLNDNVADDHYDELRLEDHDMMGIFDPEVDKVVELIEKQIEGVRVLMLVGGFSASPYLRKCIKRRFESRVEEVVIPEEPGSAICHGAVQLHMNKDIIQSRICKRTYGISCERDAKSQDPPELVYVDDDGRRRCMRSFEVFAREGERVPWNESIKRKQYPIVHGQEAMSIPLYSSTRKYPEYTTEEEAVLEGSFRLDIAEGMELDKQRCVEVSMVFGTSLIEVSARRLNFGKADVERGLCTVTFHKA